MSENAFNTQEMWEAIAAGRVICEAPKNRADEIDGLVAAYASGRRNVYHTSDTGDGRDKVYVLNDPKAIAYAAKVIADDPEFQRLEEQARRIPETIGDKWDFIKAKAIELGVKGKDGSRNDAPYGTEIYDDDVGHVMNVLQGSAPRIQDSSPLCRGR